MADGDGGRVPKPEDAIAEKLAAGGLGDEMRGETHRDHTGRAVYWINADQAGIDWSAIACERCAFVSVMPLIPKRPVAFWTCPRCKLTYRLEPPIPVLAAAQRPIRRTLDSVLPPERRN